MQKKSLVSLLLVMLISSILTGCDTLSETDVRPNPDGWQQIAPGLEWRAYPYESGTSTEITVVRIDPAFYTFRVHHTPEVVLSRREWEDSLPGAAVFINASFYDENNMPLGLLVMDGAATGISYQDRGGTFFVENGVPGLRSNVNEPLRDTPVEQAVQAFPMLVINGQQAYTDATPSARRSAVGIDQQGHVLLMFTSRGGTTLNGLSAFLAQSDMALVNAMNLDGGGSTMMTVRSGDFAYRFASLDPVPVVLAAHPR